LVAARYVTRFRCLAGDCEATCCAGLGITLEASEHRRLKVLAAGDPAREAILERAVQLTPNGPHYAQLRTTDGGGCPALDETGLCRIHAQFGHDALFDVCATYPRYANDVDGELEVFGALSCPEMVRLALLSEDGFELEPLQLEAPRKLRNRFETKHPYFRPFRRVQSAVLKLLSEPGYTLSQKLFVLLWAGDKLRPVLHARSSNVPEAGVVAVFDALGESAVLGALASSYASLPLDGRLALRVLHSALRPATAPQPSANTGRFESLVAQTWQALALPVDADPNDSELASAWARLDGLRSAQPPEVSERLTACLTRYVANHALTTPYMLYESFFDYAYDLVVRVASLRLLLFTHSAVVQATPTELDGIIVATTFTFARAVDHTDLPRRLQAALAQQGLDSLAHCVAFLAV
jgi:lysine-N-methylase